MKKLTIIAAALFLAASVYAEGVFTLLSATPGASLATTNRAQVYSVTVSSPNATIVELYDVDATAAPYYGTNIVIPSYVSKSTYLTNLVSSFVGYNGVTNTVTNVGIYTISVTNSAATNKAPVIAAISAPAGVPVSIDIPYVFSRGIAVHASATNTTTIINYK